MPLVSGRSPAREAALWAFGLHALFAIWIWLRWGSGVRGGLLFWMDFPVSLAFAGLAVLGLAGLSVMAADNALGGNTATDDAEGEGNVRAASLDDRGKAYVIRAVGDGDVAACDDRAATMSKPVQRASNGVNAAYPSKRAGNNSIFSTQIFLPHF